MDIQLAEKQVKDWAEANSHSLGFKGSNLEVNYIRNPGGFVNQSYRVSDGETIRHVKLVQERRAPHLKQWSLINNHLTNHYHAPHLIAEITQEIIPGYAYGLVFDFIQAQPLSSSSNPIPVIEKVLQKLNQLHSDQEIKKIITSEENSHSYAQAFIQEYISRFEEDLQVIRSEKHLLHFVTESTLDWFGYEIETLRKTVNQTPSFQQNALDVVHNDINWENILSANNHDLWIIDWDDLTVSGDAAMDYSVLLWPLYHSQDWPSWKNQLISLGGDELLERIEFYFRAKLFDEVIDVLADYIESDNIPEMKKITQKRAKEIHLRAYPEYLRLYAR